MQVIPNRDHTRLIAAASQRLACDLAITNIQLVNVITGEIYPATVEILDGIITHIDTSGTRPSKCIRQFDGEGQYLLPGFIDIHMHVESSMMVPEHFGQQAALCGTTSVFVDPHEIGNVLGLDGIKFMIDNAKRSPIRQFNLAPSCIPSDCEFETSLHPVMASEMDHMLQMDGIFGIAEVMDYTGVINDTQRMHDILQQGLKRHVMIQGHSPQVSERDLSAYILGGPQNTHTARSAEEVLENIRNGMHVNLQSSSLINSSLFDALKGLQSCRWTDYISLCTDDVHAKDLLTRGHINAVIKQLLDFGIDAVTAIRWGTINAAKEAGIEDLGAIAPGYAADLQLVEQLDGRNPSTVFVNGKLIVENKRNVGQSDKQISTVTPAIMNTVHLPVSLSADDFILCAPKNAKQIAIVDCSSKKRSQFSILWGNIKADNDRVILDEDLCFVAVCNRSGMNTKAIAVYHELGLIQGAMATTISHDCHNLVVAYRDPRDALTAARHLQEIGGGICLVQNNQVCADIPLPYAGLMSDMSCTELVSQIEKLETKLQEIMKDPSLLKLSLLSLPVLPGISITEHGLVDGSTRKKVYPFRTEQ